MPRCLGCPHKQHAWEGAGMLLGGNQCVQGGDTASRASPAPGQVSQEPSVLLAAVPLSLGLWVRCLFSINR